MDVLQIVKSKTLVAGIGLVSVSTGAGILERAVADRRSPRRFER